MSKYGKYSVKTGTKKHKIKAKPINKNSAYTKYLDQTCSQC